MLVDLTRSESPRTVECKAILSVKETKSANSTQ